MTTLRNRLELLIWTAVAVAGAGLALLVTTTWIVFLTTNAGDLLAAYRAGEEPWTSIGVVLALVGASAALLLGLLGTLARMDLVRLVLLIVPVVVAAGWWAAAIGLVGFPDFSGPDPVGFAFDRPVVAVVGLLAPAVAAALLALSADPERQPPVNLRPVHESLAGRPDAEARRASRRMAPIEDETE